MQEPLNGRNRLAFTLIELLVVIVILGILAMIAFALTSSSRETTRIAASVSNVRQLGAAALLYAMENDGKLPIRDSHPLEHNWTYSLFPIVYERPFPGWVQWETADSLNGTIFHSPMLDASEGIPLRSYAINTFLVSWADPSDLRPSLSSVRDTGKTLLFTDGKNKSDTGGIHQIAFRNRGKAVMVFLDGHVETRFPEEVPPDANGTGADFWFRY